jgi:hypothetical protein
MSPAVDTPRQRPLRQAGDLPSTYPVQGGALGPGARAMNLKTFRGEIRQS